MQVTRRYLRATLNYKTDKFIPWDTGQTSGIPRLINEPLIPTSYLTRASTSPRPRAVRLSRAPRSSPVSHALTPRWTRVIESRNLDDRVIRSLASADLTIITFTLPARIRRHDTRSVKGRLSWDHVRKPPSILSTSNQIFISNLHVHGNNLCISKAPLRERFVTDGLRSNSFIILARICVLYATVHS